MKNFAKKVLVGAFGALLLVLVASCYNPSPFYGVWSDNLGDSLQFNDDGTYSATIKLADDTVEMYSGTFKVSENVVSFTFPSAEDPNKKLTLVTEWDIRGSILYLDWTYVRNNQQEIKSLSLYHN